MQDQALVKTEVAWAPFLLLWSPLRPLLAPSESLSPFVALRLSGFNGGPLSPAGALWIHSQKTKKAPYWKIAPICHQLHDVYVRLTACGLRHNRSEQVCLRHWLQLLCRGLAWSRKISALITRFSIGFFFERLYSSREEKASSLKSLHFNGLQKFEERGLSSSHFRIVLTHDVNSRWVWWCMKNRDDIIIMRVVDYRLRNYLYSFIWRTNCTGTVLKY